MKIKLFFVLCFFVCELAINAQAVHIFNALKVIQVIDKSSILAKSFRSSDFIRITEIDTSGLYDGCYVENFKTYLGHPKTLLLYQGTYSYFNVLFSKNTIRSYAYVANDRIKLKCKTYIEEQEKDCIYCNGTGRLPQKKGKMGRRICGRCKGKGFVLYLETIKTPYIILDGKKIKVNEELLKW